MKRGAARDVAVAVGLAWALVSVLGWTGCGGGGASENVQLAARYVAAGDDCLAQGDLRKAIAAYSKAIQLDPENKKAFLCRGMALSDANRHQQAVADYTSAIALDPRDSFPYERRAAIYRDVLHDPARAKADDDKAALIRQKRWSDLQNLSK